jgi:hypothetical protein
MTTPHVVQCASMFERRHQPLLPTAHFRRRLARYFGVAGTIVVSSLALGIVGYHFIVGLPWIDAFLNASMILSGMGPVNEIHGDFAKLFAGCYALLSGLVVLTTAAILFAPVVHRMLHRFHRSHMHDRVPPDDSDHPL